MQSERLIYTRYIEADFEHYKRQTSSYEVMKYINGKVCTEEEAKEKFAKIMTANSMHNELGYFVVKTKEDEKVIGLAKLLFYGAERGLNEGREKGQAEIGYSLEPEFWGKGYATEIAKYLSEYAKNFDEIKELIGFIDPANDVSKKVLVKCGYKYSEDGLWNNLPTTIYKLELK